VLDVKKIKELVQLMVEHDLAEVSLRDGGQEISLRRTAAASAVFPPPVPGHAPLTPGVEQPPMVEAPGVPSDNGLVAIRSPMVGTFYSSQRPDAPPFVQLGSLVGPDTVVCIVEAMKVFNEIKADVAGTVERVLARNEDAVEYGQELFLVRPAS